MRKISKNIVIFVVTTVILTGMVSCEKIPKEPKFSGGDSTLSLVGK